MNQKLVLTYSQLTRRKFKVPHFYILKGGKRVLFYFGANHSHNSGDKQYALLDKFWKKFLRQTENKKRLVLVEGGKGKRIPDRKKAIKLNAEHGFINQLAFKNRVRVESPEPTLRFEAKQLLKRYPKDEIEYYYFARVVRQWHRIPKPKPNLRNYVNRFLKKDKAELGWKNYAFSIPHMEKIHKQLFHKSLDFKDEKFFNNLINPYKSSRVNRIAGASGRIRDLFILKEIQKYWNKGNNLFIVYGAYHAFMQRKVLEGMVAQSQSF